MCNILHVSDIVTIIVTGRAQAVEAASVEEDYDSESEDDVVDETKIKLKVPADVHVNMDTSLGMYETVCHPVPSYLSDKDYANSVTKPSPCNTEIVKL